MCYGMKGDSGTGSQSPELGIGVPVWSASAMGKNEGHVTKSLLMDDIRGIRIGCCFQECLFILSPYVAAFEDAKLDITKNDIKLIGKVAN